MVLRPQTSGSFCACGVAMLHYVSSDLNFHTNTSTLALKTKKGKKSSRLAFSFNADCKSIGIHPPWKTVTFCRSSPMIRNKLCLRLTDIWRAGSCLECRGSTETVCVCVCVCTCMYLPDQGHTPLWAAQPEGPVGIA